MKRTLYRNALTSLTMTQMGLLIIQMTRDVQARVIIKSLISHLKSFNLKMIQKNITKFLLLTIAFTFALSINYIFAAWTGPIQAPPGGNAPTPVHIGTTNQVKDGGLGLNALSVFGNGYFQDNVGIGTASPQAKLDVAGNVNVAGKIKVGDDSVSPTAGTIRWTGSDLEVYDGSAWKSLTSGDTTIITSDVTDCNNNGGNWVDSQGVCYFP